MKSRVLFICILALAAFLRLYKVSEIPPSLYWDEAAAGYNAKAIAETGKDEYGHPWPLFFQSFEDYKLPGYVYSTALAVKFLGLNELSVRIPSAIFGISAVAIIYFVGRDIGGKRMGLLASLLMATVPSHIHFSRQGFEANLGLTVFILGIWMFLKDRRLITIVLGSFFFSLSMYFYNSYRILVPVIIPALLLRYFRVLKLKRTVLGLLVFFIMMIPFIVNWTDESEFSRYKQVGIIGNPEVLYKIPTALIHHRYYVYAETFIKGYFSHFTLKFWFGSGDGNPRHQAGDIGLIYKFQLPLIILGIYYGYRKKRSLFWTILLIFLLIPIPAALTLPTPHTLRTLRFGAITSLVSAWGYLSIVRMKNRLLSSSLKVLFVIALLFFMNQYLNYYYKDYPKASSRAWAYGYKQAVLKMKDYQKSYSPIFFTGAYWRPYIYTLFYLDIPAAEFQKNPVHEQIRDIYFGYAPYDSTDRHFKYATNQIDFRAMKNAMMILSPNEVKSGDDVIDRVYDLNGDPLFLFVRTHGA